MNATTSKVPAQYRAPLRSRKAITAWLVSSFSRRHYDGTAWLLCLNVRAGSADLSFDHLLAYAAEERPDIRTHRGDPVWEKAARAVYDESAGQLWDWAIEDARRTFNGRKGKHYCKPDDDGFNALPDGTPVDVEFAFLGRSGGWLVLTHFEGYEMSNRDGYENPAFAFDALPFPVLRLLYRYAVMLRADLTGPGLTPADRVEDAAAWALFVNLCRDDENTLPTSEGIAKEAAERAHWEARDTITA